MGLFSRNKTKSIGVCYSCGSSIIDDVSRKRVFVDSNGKNFELPYHYFPPCSISEKKPDNCEWLASSTSIHPLNSDTLVKLIKIEDELGIINKWKNETFSLLQQGEFKEALTNFNELLKINPMDMGLLGNKGYTLMQLGKYEDAINCLDKGLEIDPNNVAVLCNKGHTLNELGKYEDAINCLDKVLDIEPNNEVAIDKKEYALKHKKNISNDQNEDVKTNTEKTDSFKPSARWVDDERDE